MTMQQKTLDFLEIIKGILDKYGKMSLRELYYHLEAIQAIEGGPKAYQQVKYVTIQARKKGLFDPALFIDESRDSGYVSEGDKSVDDFLSLVENMYESYTRNFWESQENYVEVWLEKRALKRIFRPICQEMNVRLVVCGGDQSLTLEYEATQRFLKKKEQGKKNLILYFGDFNPYGWNSPIAILRNMEIFGCKGTMDVVHDIDEICVELKRIALLPQHVKKYNLPENPTKKTSKKDITIAEKWMKQCEEWGFNNPDVNVELDALKVYQPKLFEDLIALSLIRQIDPEKVKESAKEVEKEREEIKKRIKILPKEESE